MRARIGLGLALALVGGVATAAPMSFDVRNPHARLLVAGRVASQRVVLIVDTGSPIDLLSGRFGDLAHLQLGEEHVSRDAFARGDVLHSTDAELVLDGVSRPISPLLVEDRGSHSPLAQSGADGLLSPQRAVADDRALVIDIPGGRIDEIPKKGAFDRTRDRARLLADLPRREDGHFVTAVSVSGQPLEFEIDTGAPRSVVYLPTDPALPAGATRETLRRARLQLGAVRRDVMLDEITPAAPAHIDGLLGLDVLRDCTITVTSARMRISCDAVEDLGVAAAPMLRKVEHECLGDGGPCLSSRVEGGWLYSGNRLDALVDPRGHVTFARKRGRLLSMPSIAAERAWFMDSTGAVRDKLDREAATRSSLEYLPRLLTSVWGDSHRSPAARRELLFRMWNECAEPSDPDRGAVGAHARHVITAFVRRVAPAGSPDAYTTVEVSVLNQERSEGPRFDPYRAEPATDY